MAPTVNKLFSNKMLGRASLIFSLLFFSLAWSQETKIIQIQKAGSSQQDESLFPGATILLRNPEDRVHLFHEGALIVSDRAYFYAKKNFFRAQGEVVFTQGDSLKMTCQQMEYDGQTQQAKAWGSVVLKRPDMVLQTDTLYLDRKANKAFYNTPGKVIDQESTLTSNKGIYFMKEKKYRFLYNVKIKNPEYKVNAQQLDYFTERDYAFFYGPSTIVGEDYTIYSERGFYNMKAQKGNFEKNAQIDYDGRIINGDSLYFENEKQYAAGTNRVRILDTLNQSIIQGHFGEIYKARDSAIITRRAVATNIIESDSLFIHADTLIATGPDTKRILRGFYDVRILKSDMRAKSDSIYFNETTGGIRLYKRPLTEKEKQVFTKEDLTQRNPVMWFGNSQMTGNYIELLSNLETKKLDSLKIRGNVFVIEKDSLSSDGYNQIKGGLLNGSFKDGNLENIYVEKNTQVVYYLYSDEDKELIGINKTLCSALDMIMGDQGISDITFLVSPGGDVFPDFQIDTNERKLKGFLWRDVERPRKKSDLFSEKDKSLKLPKIRGIPLPVEFNAIER